MSETIRSYYAREGERRAANLRAAQVYFILCDNPDGFIKIGLADNPSSRPSMLQTGCPYPLRLLASMPGGIVAEKGLHQRFAADQVIGEWFRPSPDLLALIASLQPRGVDTGERHFVCENCPVPCLDCDVPHDPNSPWVRQALFEESLRTAVPQHVQEGAG